MTAQTDSLDLVLDLQRAEALVDVARERRSVRSFEPGRRIPRPALELICEAGRWAPSGANSQPWELVVVDEPERLAEVAKVFADQADRINRYCKGFPHVHKKHWVHEAAAIILLFADPRWEDAYPKALTAEDDADYVDNRTNIFLVSVGAAGQNMHLAAAALGLSTAWLSGGGEPTTAAALRELLGAPEPLVPYATIPIGWPHRRSEDRWRRPADEVIHWNSCDADRVRDEADIERYIRSERRDSIYRDATLRARLVDGSSSGAPPTEGDPVDEG
jgi:nitroreductase